MYDFISVSKYKVNHLQGRQYSSGAITKQPVQKSSPGPDVKPVKVSIKQGDITQERCDAIIHPSNGSFDFNGRR